MIEPVKYGNDEFYMCAGMWYRMNADGFDYVSNFIRRHCVREADIEYFNKSVEVIKFKFERSQKLYIKIVGPNIHFLYRSDYNPRYMHEPWMDLNDAIVNQSKNREQTSKEEFDALYNGIWPTNSSLDDIILRSGDDIYFENDSGAHSSIVHDSDGKRIKDSSFANDNIIKIIRNGNIIYDRQAVDRATTTAKRAQKLIMNSVYGARHFPTMSQEVFDLVNLANGAKTGKSTFNALEAALDGMLGAPLCGNKKEKVMEDNKIEAVRNIVKDYYEAQLESINKEYENVVKQVKEKDENYKAAKEYVAFVNNRIDKETQDEIAFEDMPITLTRDTHIAIETVDKIREERISALKDKCALTKNLLGMCDTFEQRFNILIAQKIIANDTLKEEKKTTKRGK